MAKKKPRRDLRRLGELYQYAAENEGRKQSVRLGGKLVHTVESGELIDFSSLPFDNRHGVVGYWIRLTRADGAWTRIEFSFDGRLRRESSGGPLDCE